MSVVTGPEPHRVRRFGKKLVSVSPAMCEVIDVLERFAGTDITIMLLGETGSG